MPRCTLPTELISVLEVSKRMGIAPTTIQEMLKDGSFPGDGKIGFAIPPRQKHGRWQYKIIRAAFNNYMDGKMQIDENRFADAVALKVLEQLKGA